MRRFLKIELGPHIYRTALHVIVENGTHTTTEAWSKG